MADPRIEKIRETLRAFLYNPHVLTNVLDGKHSAMGFCQTCADQYFSGNEALRCLEELEKEFGANQCATNK